MMTNAIIILCTILIAITINQIIATKINEKVTITTTNQYTTSKYKPPTNEQREKWLSEMPENIILAAPYTPYKNDESRTLNATEENVYRLAKNAKRLGVNLVWVPGSMGQFQALSVDERKLLLEYWVKAGKDLDIYVIAHVGSNCIQKSRDLAVHAASIGADAIASVPPFYLFEPTTTDANIDIVLDFLKEISMAAPSLPFFYYHIVPNIFQNSITEFLTDATTKFPHLIGIKWVKLSFPDWFASIRQFNKTHALLFAPEPKIASFSLGPGRGVVLAEDFYAPTYLNMQKLYYNNGGGDGEKYNSQVAASIEQEWKYKAEGIFGKYGGTAAKRMVYEKFIGFDMGPSRRPLLPFVGDKNDLFNELDSIGFFNHTTTTLL